MMQKDSGKNGDDFIVELLEQVSGGPVLADDLSCSA